jgi:two-component system, cell cycle response regulator
VMLDAGGGAGSMQLLGWLVPVSGAQKGQLFTLAPHTTIGTDPKCQVVLTDGYMSSRHAEIKAEGGVWVLKDLGSTNGTYVNDRRVDKHELVDNDFVKFGQALVKFKSL